ncbi:hypothetical protein [Serratia marcescens]|uniref:hypothetical protein n=1 Tax=Serratia marcescens TaxID=615 RepID=UPI00148D3AFD|nr:hypothetical protein [Serratia marcescens]QJU41344.1 hypothetical protein HMI62_19370 [Serratia marcescens]
MVIIESVSRASFYHSTQYKTGIGALDGSTGKSIEIDRRSCAQGLLEVSALSVVVNAQADARPMYKQRSWQAVIARACGLFYGNYLNF